jgi:trimeric autotransporter adhesin
MLPFTPPRIANNTRRCLTLVVAAGSAASIAAQNCIDWNGGTGLVTFNFAPAAIKIWDRDGAGPLPPLWVVAGGFTEAGNQIANRIATFDPATSTWGTLGSGMTNTLFGQPYVSSLAIMPNGDLVAGGTFAEAGGQWAADGVARWDGVAWHRFGLGIPGGVSALAVLPNGDLIAGGQFTVTGTSITNIARWNGVGWSAMGGGVTFAPRALTVAPNGDLIAAGNVPASNSCSVARWDGSAWTAMGPVFPGSVRSLHHLPNGTLVLGGGIAFGPITYSTMAWNGSHWSPLGGLQGTIGPLAQFTNGDLLAMSDVPRRWNGASWAPFAPAIQATPLMITASDEVLAVAPESGAGWPQRQRLLRSQGGPWQTFGSGVDGTFLYAAALPNGDVLVSGGFEVLPSGIKNLARWDGANWSQFGSPVAPISVRAILPRSNGRVVVAADFDAVVSPNCRIAEWNGTSWSALGSYWLGDVSGVVELPDGSLVAVGFVSSSLSALQAARWDGSVWTPLGGSLTTWLLFDMTVLPDGSIVILGNGLLGTYGAIRWNGSAWSPWGGAGSIQQSFVRLRVAASGELLALTRFTNTVARFPGGTWQSIAGPTFGNLADVIEMPNGDLLAGISSSSSMTFSALWRWNGTSWAEVGPVARVGTFGDHSVRRLVMPRPGEVVVVGSFLRAAGQVANGFVRMQSLCPAMSLPQGSGCSQSGAPASLQSVALPWLGSLSAVRADQLPPSCVAVTVTGFSAISVPLGVLLPPSPTSCSLLVAPDALQLAAVLGGTTSTSLAIPAATALIGTSLHRQVVAIELDAGANPVRSIATNALQLTIGSF